MNRIRLALALILLVALALPLPALAGPDGDVTEGADTPSFDTPAPPSGGNTGGAQRTPKPTTRPDATPAPFGAAFPLTPDRAGLTIGYSGSGVLPQAPLLLAKLAGYFEDLGFSTVDLIKLADPLPALRSGDLDFAVIDAQEAAAASDADPSLRAVAGYRNYRGNGGAYGGDLLMASPGLVANEPATLIAFLTAYVAALGDLGDADAAIEALRIIEASDLAVDPGVAANWSDALGAFAPFDGGFGSVDDDGGLGELDTYLAETGGTEPDLDMFIARHTLNIAQVWSQLPANPVSGLAGAPGLTEITVGLPLAAAAVNPVAVAQEAGYFEDAGFTSVEVMDVEQPLLGVLQGELEFGIIDAVDAADGAAQGLPLVALAGHHNYAADGAYGGDFLTTSADLIDEEGSTVSAFLIAYIRALRDLAADADGAAFAPHDGGFGARDQAGGLGELGTYLSDALGADAELEGLIDQGPLEYAQAWWGLPANPTDVQATNERAE